jgi:universal stress protein E
VLAAAVELEQAIDGAVHVFHGFDLSSALAVSADALSSPISAPVRDLNAALMREHWDAVLALTDRHALDRARVHVHEGPVRQQLIASAREMNADLLAIAAVSRSGLPRRFVGSTAEQVLEEAPCDLLIVAP